MLGLKQRDVPVLGLNVLPESYSLDGWKVWEKWNNVNESEGLPAIESERMCTLLDGMTGEQGMGLCGFRFNNANKLSYSDAGIHGQGVYFCSRSIPVWFTSTEDYEIDPDNRHLREIVYIGKTNNLATRMQSHHKKQAFQFLGVDTIYFLAMDSSLYSQSDLLWAERQYIDLICPLLNDRTSDPLLSESIEVVGFIGLEEHKAACDAAFKKGFQSAKAQMMNFFDSAMQMS